MSTFAEIKARACKLFDIPNDDKCRLWSMLSNKPWNQLNDETKALRDTQILREDLLCLELQADDGSWPFTKKTDTTSYSSSSHTYSSSSSYTSGASKSTVSPPAYRKDYTPTPPGLSNLGNTCFMNSGLQCLVNTELLAKFFMDRKYIGDINEKNPIGCGGKLARAFASLLEKMAVSSSSIAPYDIKTIISEFAPQFSGYQQHDSQELIAFMLDGLHEDLNRIQKKPYIAEDPEAEKLPDVERALKMWDDHKKRNDSIIVDLFHSQVKSTLVCPDCGKVCSVLLSTCFTHSLRSPPPSIR
jgi:ubiquitin carboxyl-terminal hydrolase 4/11/15